MDVAIDNSSLLEVANDPALLSALVERITRERLRLVVPFPVLGEFTSGSDHAAACVRVAQLLRIVDSLADRFVLTGDLTFLLPEERRRPLTSTPRPAAAANILATLRRGDLVQHLPRITADLERYFDKAGWLQADREAQDYGRERFRGFKSRDLDDRFRDFGNNLFFWGSPFATRMQADGHAHKRRAHPSRYPVSVMHAAYGFLNAIGTLLSTFDRGEYRDLLGTPRRGNWTDLDIAACSAPARVLLSQDKGQSARANFVARSFGLKLRAVPLDTWLGS